MSHIMLCQNAFPSEQTKISNNSYCVSGGREVHSVLHACAQPCPPMLAASEVWAVVLRFRIQKSLGNIVLPGRQHLAEVATRQAEAMLSHCCVSVACEYLLGSCKRVRCVVLCHM